ncbi:MAG TPA: FAD-binding oxidoreductase, partial [Firmicutes bacterium]|nr:FAD-binding oxidoreductase [Bacillota bacterium]
MDIERQLTGIVGRKWVFSGPAAQRLYSHDTSAFHGLPQLVVLPGDREQVAAVLAACTQAGVPVTPRGAGTCLSGGPVPVQGGIVLALTRLNHILHLDPVESLAVAEPGVTNQQLQKAAARHGLMFPPDPASQRVSTLGGNVAENAGGPRAFKYGVTRNYVLALEYTLPDGTVQETRWDAGNGPDLTSLLVGSEGTLAVLTRLALRLVPLPTHYLTLTVCFATVEQACR